MLKTYTYIHMDNIEITIEAEVTEGKPVKWSGIMEDSEDATDTEVEIVHAYTLGRVANDRGLPKLGELELELDGTKVFDGKEYTDLSTHIIDQIISGDLEEV